MRLAKKCLRFSYEGLPDLLKLSPGQSATGWRSNSRWAIRGQCSQTETVVFAVLGLLVPLLGWLALSKSGLLPEIFMPGPVTVTERLWRWWQEEGFSSDLSISVWRVSVGFFISVVTALPLALLAGTFRPIQILLEPLMDFIRYMPAVAFIPLAMLWFGIGEPAKIAIIFIGTFFQMVLMMADDVRRVPIAQIEAAQTLGASRREAVFMVILRSALPSLLDTCRITLGWAWTYLVVAEIVSANEGLGYAILKAQRFLQTDKIFAGIIVIGLIGLLQDQALRQLRRLIFPYLGR
jgi:NitT/TauT family transport system permease protein